MKQKMTSNDHSDRKAWTEEVMHSLDGLQRATAPEGLYDRIVQQLQKVPVVSKQYVWLAAAGLALLFVLNVWAWQSRSGAKPAASNLAEQFQLTTPSTVDYN